MADLRTAAQQALEALSFSCPAPDLMSKHEAAEAALRAALEQPTGKESLTVPPEAQTEAEKIAYCAGWWAAMEAKAKEQTEQEPVAWIQSNHLQKAQQEPFLCRVEPMQRLPDFVPLYTHPPRREWQGLTEEEIKTMYDGCDADTGHAFVFAFARAIEAALKEKNK